MLYAQASWHKYPGIELENWDTAICGTLAQIDNPNCSCQWSVPTLCSNCQASHSILAMTHMHVIQSYARLHACKNTSLRNLSLLISLISGIILAFKCYIYQKRESSFQQATCYIYIYIYIYIYTYIYVHKTKSKLTCVSMHGQICEDSENTFQPYQNFPPYTIRFFIYITILSLIVSENFCM